LAGCGSQGGFHVGALAMTPPNVEVGDTGPAVEEAQYLLVRRLILEDQTQIDGIFGPITEQAVKQFQEMAHLAVDGIVGPITWAALLQGYDIPQTLRQGSSGDLVARLQKALNEGRGSFVPASNATLVVDGLFGPLTAGVVESTQAEADIAADGIVGLQTWAIRVRAADQMLAGVCGAWLSPRVALLFSSALGESAAERLTR
jgi:peptidoglycan hydrolase-like protein with peptidoglycan-binding domain